MYYNVCLYLCLHQQMNDENNHVGNFQTTIAQHSNHLYHNTMCVTITYGLKLLHGIKLKNNICYDKAMNYGMEH